MDIIKSKAEREAFIRSHRTVMAAAGFTPTEEIMHVEQRYIDGEFTSREEYEKALLNAAGIVMSEEEYQRLISPL